MSESTLQREIMLAVSKLGHRVFRNNTGQGWIGSGAPSMQRSQHGDRYIALCNPRPLHAGLCVGSSDLIGYTNTGRFLAIEVKSKRGVVTKEQQNFIDQVNAAGGVGIIARSVEDVIRELSKR